MLPTPSGQSTSSSSTSTSSSSSSSSSNLPRPLIPKPSKTAPADVNGESGAEPAELNPQAVRACLPCRERKRKCDGNQPCQSCVKRDVECFFAAPRKRGPHGDKAATTRRDGPVDVSPGSMAAPSPVSVGGQSLEVLSSVVSGTRTDHDHVAKWAKTGEQQRVWPSSSSSSSAPSVATFLATPASFPSLLSSATTSSRISTAPPTPSMSVTQFLDPLVFVPQHLRNQYERYFWAFFIGPQKTLYPIEREVIISAAISTFSKERPADKGACRGVGSTNCPCFLAAQAGLTWAVLAIGAQTCGYPGEAIRFIVLSRKSLQQSISCLNEVTAFAFALLHLYYYGLRDFRLSLFFTKMKLDILNSLPPSSRTESLKAMCDYTCLQLHIPSSPTSKAPVQLLEQDLREFEALLHHDPGSPAPLPTIQRAIYATLKLLGECLGYLLFVERLEGTLPMEDYISLVERDMGLCQAIFKLWRPFGALNEIMESIYESIEVWIIYLIIEVERKDGQRLTQPSQLIRPRLKNQAELLKEQVSYLYLEERKFLDEILPIISQRIASRFSSQADTFSAVDNMEHLSRDHRLYVRPPPSKLRLVGTDDLKARALLLCHSIADTTARNSQWARYLPPTLLASFVNAASVMSEWNLWSDLENFSSYFREMSFAWPLFVNALAKVDAALQMKRDCDATGREMPRITLMRVCGNNVIKGITPEEKDRLEHAASDQIQIQSPLPLPPPLSLLPQTPTFLPNLPVTPLPTVEYDFSVFWSATPGPEDLRDILGDVDTSVFATASPLSNPFSLN